MSSLNRISDQTDFGKLNQGASRKEDSDPDTLTFSFTSLSKPRGATASSEGQITLSASESVTFVTEGDTGVESEVHPSTNLSCRPQSAAGKGQPQYSSGTAQSSTSPLAEGHQPDKDQKGEREVQEGSCRLETKNYLKQLGVNLKPRNPFQQKFFTVYSVFSPENSQSKHGFNKSTGSACIRVSHIGNQTLSQGAHGLANAHREHLKLCKEGHRSASVHWKSEPELQNYISPVVSVGDKQQTKPQGAALNSTCSYHSPHSTTLGKERMNTFTNMDISNTVGMPSLSRTQERVELQHLNDRFAAYIQHVRRLVEQNNQVDSSAFIKTTKALEVEIHNLKNMYEQELEKLRKELEGSNHEKMSCQVQVNKQLQYTSELQERLNVESDKNSKLQDEINNYQRRVGSLEAEIQDMRITSSRPRADLEQLQRTIDSLTRDVETWKHRYEHEQVARQEAETKIQQLVQKSDFNSKVHTEQIGELNTRVESSAATILSLEAKVRDLSKTDISLSEMLRQVRETAEGELRKFQLESEEQYNRNLTALKAQLDNEAKAVQGLEAERSQLQGSVGELKARIRSLEGQVANLEHQKQTLEDAVAVERNRAADGARSLERKLREVQDMLVVKMREVTTAREQNIPLKAEIEALKVMLEEEEKRLKLTLMTSTSSSTNTTLPASLPSALPTTLPPLSSSSATAGLLVPLRVSGADHMGSIANPTSFINSYNITSSMSGAAASATVTSTMQPSLSTACPPLASTTPAVLPTSSAPQNLVSFAAEPQSYAPSPPMSVTYIPEFLETPAAASTAYGSTRQYEAETETQLHGLSSTIPLAKYSYETTPGLTRVTMEPSPQTTPRAVGPVRAKSAPEQRPDIDDLPLAEDLVGSQQNLNLVGGDLGQGHDYFDRMFHHDFHGESLKGRPKSTPLRCDRPLSSLYHDYTVSTSSATGDLKIFEVHQEGKYIRLLNDGVQEVEFGGYMLQQTVGGHPVAVFRFPPRTKFAPNSTITVYAGCNDHKLHNPPQDFVWKEQQKWGTGPECTTILCRSNGQAVAWTTAAHRFTRDAFQDGQSEPDEDMTRADEEKQLEALADDETLTEISMNVNGPKPDPVYLRREKQQPPCLQANKHPHGSPAAASIHPHTGQPRPLRYGNDNSSNNRQSRAQTTRPDPVIGQPYAGAAAQKMGSAPLRKFVTGVSTQPTSGIRAGIKTEGAGEASEVPSPFMKPHARFQSGLDQVQSQHHQEFLPPMPRPPFYSW